MWGAVIGDIIGSTFEHANHRSPFFELFRKDARFTDDTVCTAAIADIINKHYPDNMDSVELSHQLRLWCCTYFNRGYGSMFYQWIANGINAPYNSYGNGALMRISPVALFSVNKGLLKEDALKIAEAVTSVTHNHPDAIRAVSCYTSILYDLLTYKKNNNAYISSDNAKQIIAETLHTYEYDFPKKVEEYRVQLEFDLTCTTSLLVAAAAIFETDNFDDVMYQVVSVGGDSDTYAAIAGALAEAIYGIPQAHMESIKVYFRDYDNDILTAINNIYDNTSSNIDLVEKLS